MTHLSRRPTRAPTRWRPKGAACPTDGVMIRDAMWYLMWYVVMYDEGLPDDGADALIVTAEESLFAPRIVQVNACHHHSINN